jgi:hypothetical protein
VKTLLWMLLSCAPLLGDLAQVRAEPNLEKRSKAALENAEHSLKASRQAYEAGDLKLTAELLEELEQSVLLAEKSLKETGKDPIKSPRHFKDAEKKTGELVRRIEAFSRDMNFADKSMADKVKEEVQEAHDRLLQGIMTGKKK